MPLSMQSAQKAVGAMKILSKPLGPLACLNGVGERLAAESQGTTAEVPGYEECPGQPPRNNYAFLHLPFVTAETCCWP